MTNKQQLTKNNALHIFQFQMKSCITKNNCTSNLVLKTLPLDDTCVGPKQNFYATHAGVVSAHAILSSVVPVWQLSVHIPKGYAIWDSRVMLRIAPWMFDCMLCWMCPCMFVCLCVRLCVCAAVA